jgi:lipopolysaccharide export system protein LptA
MRITIERLRLWIVVAGVVLVLAIVSFLAYARYRVRQLGHDLPAKLGLEIQQSTNDFTVSRSKAGHTLFVLHASKAVQFKGGGHLVLHGVSIQMYDKDGKESDRMSGSQFDYDQKTGVAQAQGSVDIEMTPPVTAGSGKLSGTPGGTHQGPIHVQTSGLTFNQKTQVASTDQVLTFQDGAASGSARGASYDGEQGMLALRNDVVFKTQVNTDTGAEPVTIKAQGATFNQGLRQLVLLQSFLAYQHEDATADQATVFFRQDGSADHLVAEGHVHVVSDTGSDIKAGNAYAQLDNQSQLQQLKLTSGLLLIVHPNTAKTEDGLAQLQTLHADSDAGTLTFGPKNTLQHLQMVQAVSVVDQEVGLPGDPHGSETRELRAAKVDVNFASGQASPRKSSGDNPRIVAKDVLATGEAKVTVHTIHAAAPQQSTTVQGDQLFGTLLNGHQLSTLRGNGHTYLLLNSPGGVSQTGSADTLSATFAAPTATPTNAVPGKKANARNLPGAQTGSQILSAEQQGHVVLAELQPSTTPGAPPVKTTATADRVTYDGASGSIDLTGSPHIGQSGSDLTAGAVEFNRFTGDATATGDVKATYASSASLSSFKSASKTTAGQAEAVHVVAARATLDHAQDETTFYAAPHAEVRLWQGPDSITAPTIVLARKRQLLTASGPARSVTATFAENGKTSHARQAPYKTGNVPTAIMRIVSGSMVYSGGEHKATFTNGVEAQGSTGILRSDELEVDLSSNPAPSSPAATKADNTSGNAVPALGGQLEKVIATGHVNMQQGERHGTGENLVYTADDQHFVLTGSAASPPRVTDPVHGTVTGGSLIFNNRDDSVIVSRGQSATVTDTRTTK